MKAESKVLDTELEWAEISQGVLLWAESRGLKKTSALSLGYGDLGMKAKGVRK